jgi:hypothetical protein
MLFLNKGNNKITELEEVKNSDDQYISPIFTVPKKDGEHRMILNLKDLTQNIEYYHFKMDTFETALKLIKPNCFMTSIDTLKLSLILFLQDEDYHKNVYGNTIQYQKCDYLMLFLSMPSHDFSIYLL